MKISKLLCIAVCVACGFVNAQNNEVINSDAVYDSTLAKKLGADEYGMKQYVMAFLKSGPKKITDSTKREEIQRAHLKNIMRLTEEGFLIVAGPFLDDQKIRGIFIFNVESVEEAKKLAETDPAVKAGVLALELHPWYGSAALLEIPKIHPKLEKRKLVE